MQIYKPLLKDKEKTEELLRAKKLLEEQEKQRKDQKQKIDNYSKYVREMYWPKVSVKKQLELEHIVTTLKNSSIRKSAGDLEAVSEQHGDEYDRPWRLAMSSKREHASTKLSPYVDPEKKFTGLGTNRFYTSGEKQLMHHVQTEGVKEKSRMKGNDYLAEIHMKHKGLANKNQIMVDLVLNNKNLNEY